MPARPFLVLIFSVLLLQASAQSDEYHLKIHWVDKDSSFNPGNFKFQRSFKSEPSITNYVNKLTGLFTANGFPSASIDSMWILGKEYHISFFTGKQFQLYRLTPVNIEKAAMEYAGLQGKDLYERPFDIKRLQIIKERLLTYYENHGYPFASVYLDSITIYDDRVDALLKADLSQKYTIDSIRVFGKVKLDKIYLQRLLEIENNSVYSSEKLKEVDKRISSVPFISAVQPSDVTMLGSGGVLNVYLARKRSSQFNFLVGFLPSSTATGKLQVTGDVNLDLKNLFGGGESMLFKWQQLQYKSPRLNLGFNSPYIFGSKFGFDFLFDLFKKDSSFLQLNAQVGTQYAFSGTRSGKLFLQWQSTSLLAGGVDTNLVKLTKTLPFNVDVTSASAGLQYSLNNTNYIFNPVKGNDLMIFTTAGIKKIKENFDIVGIKDPSFNYSSLYDSVKKNLYQVRVKTSLSHYQPVGKYSTLKMSFSGGMFLSPVIFRNELFQIGGYNLLRGFDEESIYATRYGVITAEYRYLVDINSYLFFFTDAALTKTKYQQVSTDNKFISGGIGMVYETKLGLLNVAYAIGKRNDVSFNLRGASRLHFGYINYF